jgi:hypothetical protein
MCRSPDSEAAMMEGKTVRCCLNDRCEDKPANVGCRAPDGIPPRPSIDERPMQEARATLEELLDVWYRGGYISKERFQVVSHEPRCLPFDYGVFSIHHDREGNWRVSELGTFSMLPSGMRWDEHPLSRILEDSIAESVGVQR